MPKFSADNPVKIAIIGAGAVSDYHHVPGIRLDPRARLTAACDANQELLDRRQRDWGGETVTTDYETICADPNVDAVIIATPNFTHKPIALGCSRQRQARDVRKAAGPECGRSPRDVPRCRDAGVVHMTAFTYRFAPSMRYLRHLLQAGDLGGPRHFRSQRFLDCPKRVGAGGNTRSRPAPATCST